MVLRRGKYALMFHGVSSRKIPTIARDSQPYVDVREFRVILQWLTKRYRFLTAEEFLLSEKPGVLLTFDDGFANNVTNVLPLLEQYQAPAVFFVTTQHVVQPKNWLPATVVMAKKAWGKGEPEDALSKDWYDGMTVDQLKRAATNELITIGAHTVSHPFLTLCTDDQVRYELSESRSWLEKKTGNTIDLFAYPTGNYDERIIALTKEAGYKAAFAADGTTECNSIYAIPRVGIYSAKRWYLTMKLSGFHRKPLHEKFIV